MTQIQEQVVDGAIDSTAHNESRFLSHGISTPNSLTGLITHFALSRANREKRLVFGIGTGRCGTTSLATLLNAQHNATFSHELKPNLSWSGDEFRCLRKVARLSRAKATFSGDVAWYYLPYAELILNQFPNARMICLQRDSKEVVNSFAGKIRNKNKNHWITHNGKRWNRDRRLDRCFPKYDVKTLEESIEKYCEHYKLESERLASLYPERFRVWEFRDALNTQDGGTALLEFAGFKDLILDSVGVRKNQQR